MTHDPLLQCSTVTDGRASQSGCHSLQVIQRIQIQYGYLVLNQILILFKGGCQFQVQLSEPFLLQSSKFFCPSEFSETPPTFNRFENCSSLIT